MIVLPLSAAAGRLFGLFISFEAWTRQSSPLDPPPLRALFLPALISFIRLRPAASDFCSISTRFICSGLVSPGTASRPACTISSCSLRTQAFALSVCLRESSAWMTRLDEAGAW